MYRGGVLGRVAGLVYTLLYPALLPCLVYTTRTALMLAGSLGPRVRHSGKKDTSGLDGPGRERVRRQEAGVGPELSGKSEASPRVIKDAKVTKV